MMIQPYYRKARRFLSNGRIACDRDGQNSGMNIDVALTTR
jgi:hypothetical protein